MSAPRFTDSVALRDTWLPWFVLVSAVPSAVLLTAVLSGDGGFSGAGLRVLALGLVAVFGPVPVFFAVRLDIEVREEGVAYRLRPFHRSWRVIPAEGVTSVRVVAMPGATNFAFGAAAVWPRAERVVFALGTDEGVEVERTGGRPLRLSSSEPDGFAAAVRAVR